MTLLPPYDIGTVTLTNGSADIVGNDTAWAVNGVPGGLMTVEVAGGNPLLLADVADDTTATAATKWMGPSGTYKYAISLESAQAADVVWANRHWSRVVGQGLLAAIRPDASGTLAERDALSPMLENGQWFARAEPPHDLEFYRKVPAGWEGPFTTRGVGGVGEGGLGLPSPGAANKAPYYSAADTISLYDQTAFGRALAALTGANGSIPVATGAGTAAMRAIVGTVSQSGGVPTGALMETGSNANGRYLRFADGTQICWHRASNFTATDVASGVLYQAAPPVAFAFPASFAAPPIVSIIADKQGGGSGALWGVMSSNQPTAGGIAFTLLSTTSGTQAKAAYIATGRWFA